LTSTVVSQLLKIASTIVENRDEILGSIFSFYEGGSCQSLFSSAVDVLTKKLDCLIEGLLHALGHAHCPFALEQAEKLGASMHLTLKVAYRN
jgi:hypothetical protein